MLWRLALPFLKRSRRLADGWQERLIPPDWLRPDSSLLENGTEALEQAADIWLQAASGGEARLAVSVCRSLSPSLSVKLLAVTWTRQGREILENALPELQKSHPLLKITVRFAPFDHPAIAFRAVAQARPRLVALLETELWPGLMAACRELEVPVQVFNGRINSSTVHFCKMFSSLMADLSPSRVHAISGHDRQGFSTIFPCPTEMMPNIKFDLAKAELSNPLICRPSLFDSGRPVFLFASVRQCEETRLPGQFARLYDTVPDASIVVVPRHLHRVAQWQSVLDDLGFVPVLVSRFGTSRSLPRRHILIWDRFGDLPQLYASARAVFVGGSFGQGGQNFLEALSAGRIPCIGPSAHNFLWAMGSNASAAPTLEEAGLLRIAHTPRDVVDIMVEQAHSPTDRNSVRERFRDWLTPDWVALPIPHACWKHSFRKTEFVIDRRMTIKEDPRSLAMHLLPSEKGYHQKEAIGFPACFSRQTIPEPPRYDNGVSSADDSAP